MTLTSYSANGLRTVKTLFRLEYTAANEDEKNKFLMTLINLSLRQSRAHRPSLGGSASDARKISVINLPPEVQIVEDNGDGKTEDDAAWPIKSQGA